jgi:hypothetical protein
MNIDVRLGGNVIFSMDMQTKRALVIPGNNRQTREVIAALQLAQEYLMEGLTRGSDK